MTTGRAAIYARYSDPQQRESSIEDQERNCVRYAQREGFEIRHTYHDKAITGAVRARPGYHQMLDAAAAGEFDVLIVDDLSRLSRDDYELKGLLRRFDWQGLRVIGVTDGYDNARKGHKIHAGFKGLMNEMFLDDLRERTHRGMTGQAIKGFNCGGRTYGYINVPIEDESRKDAYGRSLVVAVRYEIHSEQAETVRRIHEWYAAGHSYKWIASELNRRKVPASRGGTWAVSGVRVILFNEMYEGKLTWNRKEWAKHPDTGKRTYKERPSEEWIVRENPALRIVPTAVIREVRERQNRNKASSPAAAMSIPARRYLFSGLMSCSECGGNFVIVANQRYGCATNKTRGSAACSNGVTVSRHIAERRLLHSIKTRLLDGASVEKFKRAASKMLKARGEADRLESLRRKATAAERVRDNILSAIKQGILTASTRESLESAEAEIAGLKARLEHAQEWRTSSILPRAVERYQRAVEELEQRLAGHVEPAREILRSLVGERIRIHRRGEHLEAELTDCVQVVLTNSLSSRVDSGGCGGGICNESTFISLKPDPADSAPISRRHTSQSNN